jgi:protein O-GlcNAc transferase
VGKPKNKAAGFSNPKAAPARQQPKAKNSADHSQQEQQAVALIHQGRLQEAEEIYRELIAQGTINHVVYGNLAAICGMQGGLDELIELLKKTLQLKPNNPEAHNNLGNALKEQGDLVGAIAFYNTALQLKPNYPEAHYNLGNALKEQGDLNAARVEWGKASMQSPETPLYWMKYNLFFQDLYESQGGINEARQLYIENLERLVLLEKPNNCRPKSKILEASLFWIAYHNCHDDRILLEKLSSSIKSSPLTRDLQFQAETQVLARRTKGKPRIGISSQFLVDHTIGKLNQGLVERIKTSGCETVLLYPPNAKKDSFRKIIEASSDKALDLPANPLLACEIVLKEQLDILFYLDIGMSAFTYQMALSRLAPIQMTSWGHPNTTGLSTIDYFISSSLIESDNAQDYYTEQLVRLSRLPCIYKSPTKDARASSRQDFKELPRDRFLIGIPQSLFKIHPDYDQILERIALEIPSAYFVLIDMLNKLQTERLKARWMQRAPTVAMNSVFLPRMNGNRYLELLDAMDILLDPFYFGSGNTFYESMAVGTPLITMPGKYMRGRIVAGGYRQMQLDNAPVAASPDEYVQWCRRLAESKELRERMKEDIRNAAHQHLFNDQQVGGEFVEFIFAAIESACQGKKLPLDWYSTRKES